MEPHLSAVTGEYAGRVDVWKINADEQPEAVAALNVFGIPTLIAYRDGVEVTRSTGGMGAGGIRLLFDRALAEPGQGADPIQGSSMGFERWLRLAVAIALVVLAAFSGWPFVLLLAAAAVFFSAIHDRCPLWQGVKMRLGL
jgi:thioredoxin 1